ncbi:MAG: (d)CMP kinase [Acidobacteria bacterium]|nr:(d)CMP kinase [Acidobacteriota bacterium]MCZ6662159.1 (d)CMP kinase [Actinomycetota bacterium]
MTTDLIVTLDGPSGTGKSTVSRLLARRLAIPYLDTGAFYRAATLAALAAGADLSDAEDVGRIVAEAEFSQRGDRMILNGEDVSETIRSAEVTLHVSEVSAHPSVRALLVGHQRAWLDANGRQAVVEGRDIGSVVFPNASHKIYLDARPEVRAARRADQVGDKDTTEVLADIQRRDHLDSTRAASPLTIPDDAIVLDTSDLDIDQVVDRIVALVADS